jgi:hypothetical protein
LGRVKAARMRGNGTPALRIGQDQSLSEADERDHRSTALNVHGRQDRCSSHVGPPG